MITVGSPSNGQYMFMREVCNDRPQKRDIRLIVNPAMSAVLLLMGSVSKNFRFCSDFLCDVPAETRDQ